MDYIHPEQERNQISGRELGVMKKQYFVFACSFFFTLGSNILGFSMIYRLTDRLAFNPGQVGRYMALGQIFFFIGCNIYHRFGSSFNPLRVFTSSALVALLCALFVSFAKSRNIIYASYWILQVSTGLFWPPVTVWITEGFSGKDLNRGLGIFNRSWTFAIMVGPLIAGALYQWNSTANFIILNLCFFLVSFILYLMRRYTKKHETEETKPAVQAVTAASNTPKAADRRLDLYRYRAWIGGFCSGMFMGILSNILPLHIRDGLGYTESSAGMLLFFRCTASFAGFTILAKFTGWHFNRRWFIIIQSGMIFCTFLLMLAGSRLFLYNMIVLIFGLMTSACYNNSIFYSGVTGINPKKNLALHEIFLAIGNAAGSAGGGFIYQYFRFTGVCLALMLFYGIGLWAFVIINKKEAGLLTSETSAGQS
jgi:predicted MFS family arabinose efflux permease